MIILHIVSPNPVPFLLMLIESVSLPKNLKSYDKSSSFIPIPVSLTEVIN
jgi:hypothetical protein